MAKKPPGGKRGSQSSPECAGSQAELLRGGCTATLIPVSIISPTEECEAGKECYVPREGDALQMCCGIFIAGGGASTQPSAAPPWSAPFLARPQNLSSERKLLSPPPPPLQSVDLFGAQKGTVFPPLSAGLGTSSRKPSPPGQIVDEEVGEQDEKKHY